MIVLMFWREIPQLLARVDLVMLRSARAASMRLALMFIQVHPFPARYKRNIVYFQMITHISSIVKYMLEISFNSCYSKRGGE